MATSELLPDGRKKLTMKDGSTTVICTCGHWMGSVAYNCSCCNGELNNRIKRRNDKRSAEDTPEPYLPDHGSPDAVTLP